jgi:hypothetical protein
MEVVRDEMLVRDEIAAYLADGPRTIPEIARHLGHPRHEVVIWVMAMWKYGTLRDTGETDGNGYCLYDLND